MAINTSSQDLKTLGINLVKSKAAWQQMLAAGNIIKPDEFYLVQGDEATTYTFANGDNGTFTVTPSDGTAQTVNVITDYLRVNKGGTGRNEILPTNTLLASNDTGTMIVGASTKGSVSLPIYIDSNGRPQTITSYQGAARYLSVPDTRNDAIVPQSLAPATGVRFDFKSKATMGLSEGTYAGVMTFRPYGSNTDWTGGPAHQLAFNSTGKIFHRISTGNETWGDWETILTSTSSIDISKLTGVLPISKGGTGRSEDYGANKLIKVNSSNNAFEAVGTVGGSSTPVYSNAGVLTAFSSTIGGTAQPVYVSSGAITAITSNIGGTKQPIYMNAGVLTASTANEGSSTLPVYLKNGVLTAIDYLDTAHGGTGRTEALPANVLLASDSTGSSIVKAAAAGSETTPIYINNNGIATNTSPSKFEVKNAKYLKLYEARGTTTSLNKTANYVEAGAMFHLVASSSTTTGKTPTDANILQMNWDNNGGYDGQFGISTSNGRAYFRSRASAGDTWQEVAHAPVGNAVGGTAAPVYMSNTGVITVIDAVDFGHGGTGYAGNYTANALIKVNSTNTAFEAVGGIGSSKKFVYTNSNGVLTATTESIGASNKPIYMDSGEVKASTSNIGGTKTPIYMNAGTLTAFSATEGSASIPVYLKDGALTAITTLDVGHGGTGSSENITANRLVWTGAGTTANPLAIKSSPIVTDTNGNLTTTVSNTTDIKYKVGNSNGSISLYASSNRGIYDEKKSAWIIYNNTAGDHTYITLWKSIGSATQPIYFNSSGEPAGVTLKTLSINGQSVPIINNADITINTLGTGYGGTGISEAPTANRVVWSNASSQITSAANIWTDGSKLAINQTSLQQLNNNTPIYSVEVNGGIYASYDIRTTDWFKGALLEIIDDADVRYGRLLYTTGNGLKLEGTNYIIVEAPTISFNTRANSSDSYVTRAQFNENGHLIPGVDASENTRGYNLGLSNYRWDCVYAYDLNIEHNATISNNLTVSGQTFFNNGNAATKNGTVWSAANAFAGGTIFSAITDAEIHISGATTTTNNGALVVLGGVNIAKTLRTEGDIILYTANNDRSIIFGYKTTTNKTTDIGASWKLTHFGTGSGDANYFSLQSAGSTTNGSETWNNVIQAHMNTFDVGFGGAIYPLVTYDSSNHTNQNIGSRSLIWSDLFANRANVKYIQPYTKSLTSNVDNIIEFQGSSSSNGIQSSMYLQTTYSQPAFYPNDDKQGSLGLPSQRWGSLYVGEFAADYTYTKTSGLTIQRDSWTKLFSGAETNSNLENGTYIIQLTVGTTTPAIYSGICSWIASNEQDTTFTKYTEIPLHAVKVSLSNQFFLRTAIDGNGICLQISQSGSSNITANSSTNKIVVKMKKIM